MLGNQVQANLPSVKVQLVASVADSDSNVSLLAVSVTKPKYVVIDVLRLPQVLIVQAPHKASCAGPVAVLDEVDKIGQSNFY